MSESDLHHRILSECATSITHKSVHVDNPALQKLCAEYEQRIADLERTNLLMAEQLKKRDGFWLAPMIPDEEMLAAVGPWEEPENVYAAMRDDWMERNK